MGWDPQLTMPTRTTATTVDALHETSTHLVGADVSLGSSGHRYEGVPRRWGWGCGTYNVAPVVAAVAESPTIIVVVSGCNGLIGLGFIWGAAMWSRALLGFISYFLFVHGFNAWAGWNGGLWLGLAHTSPFSRSGGLWLGLAHTSPFSRSAGAGSRVGAGHCVCIRV
jgi:hypothetical protein